MDDIREVAGKSWYRKAQDRNELKKIRKGLRPGVDEQGLKEEQERVLLVLKAILIFFL